MLRSLPSREDDANDGRTPRDNLDLNVIYLKNFPIRALISYGGFGFYLIFAVTYAGKPRELAVEKCHLERNIIVLLLTSPSVHIVIKILSRSSIISPFQTRRCRHVVFKVSKVNNTIFICFPSICISKTCTGKT